MCFSWKVPVGNESTTLEYTQWWFMAFPSRFCEMKFITYGMSSGISGQNWMLTYDEYSEAHCDFHLHSQWANITSACCIKSNSTGVGKPNLTFSAIVFIGCYRYATQLLWTDFFLSLWRAMSKKMNMWSKYNKKNNKYDIWSNTENEIDWNRNRKKCK